MATASSSGLSSVLAGGADTIVARATAGGRGALAVIRVSGAEARAVAARVCPGVDFDRGWRATLTELYDAGGGILERGVIVPFPAPRSATGEDMFEATVHGSPYLVERLIEACVGAGARRAAPGEFTRRAVANGKLDLVQAEAIRDLVAAETAAQLRNARAQLAGSLSARFRALRQELTGLLALLEAALDFEAQSVVVGEDEIANRLESCRRGVRALLATAAAGERIRDGLRVAILGPPNAGKSTLFNLLCGRERAIVSPHPGTTRDILEAELEIGGVRVALLDTAGLRQGGDEVEREGHRRALAAAAEAELGVLLWSVDGVEDEPTAPDTLPVLRVASRADRSELQRPGWLRVSCVSGEGVDALRAALASHAERDIADLGGGVAIAARHRASLERAESELDGVDPARPELAAEGVRWAIRALEELVGELDVETVLDEVFATFCIGK
ncbi:MAG TPA: tRNA uridine-5-carboxymethylaminomethyl(34) synthesis GTPase MnmE [Chondromyces sp.]|nr:tRNA uridine-5-carboxymethylaminomethyl(34) synthesis GTPase MnmE [Chondromyces sp.]